MSDKQNHSPTSSSSIGRFPAVMLVEDDRILARSLKRGLEEDGYEVDVAGTVMAAFHTALARSFDSMVVDVTLPDGSGIDLVRRLRGQGLTQPILILTARGDSETTVDGLDAGADDFVVKPVPLEVLSARLRALHRRWDKSGTPIIRVGDLVLEPDRLIARRDDAEIDLTPTQSRLLELLMTRVGRVLTRSQIGAEIGDPESDPTSNVIDVHIRAIRKKIDDPFGTDSIETVRGMGYRFRRPS
jgi:two-component system OmpR family response regulator